MITVLRTKYARILLFIPPRGKYAAGRSMSQIKIHAKYFIAVNA
jgi:hypothetical protein